MPRIPKAKLTQTELRSKIPKGALRVKVETDKGHTKYKDVADIADTDVIVVNGQGEPVVMRGSPGRKIKVNPQPVTGTVKELVKRKTSMVVDDPLRKATVQDPDSDQVLQNVLLELTHEVASLAFERMEAERMGRDTSQISVRRIGGLKAVAETWLKRKDQISNKSVDPDSAGWKASMAFVLETMREAMLASGMRPEMVQTVYAKFNVLNSSDTWEPELRARIRKAV